MAANPVLFVRVEEHSYALPLGNIQGLNRISGANLQQYLETGSDALLSFNDVLYPVHYLGAVLGQEHAPLTVRAEAMYPLVYTRAGGEYIAWVVDSVQGRRDVILQSLGALFKQCHFYASATITPEGEVVMVPELMTLTEQALNVTATQQAGDANNIPAEPLSSDAQQARIMVVDDSITVRKVTEKFLHHEHFKVETARDGLEALEKLESFVPDLMLLDIEMPRMDGFELLEWVKSNNDLKHIPVVMISSRATEKYIDKATSLGCSAFLGKPYLLENLVQVFNQYLKLDAPIELD